ncbi:hypothetical protein CLG94_03195 [Candidatus Methylomirabilis limnetica]|uniref:FAD-binding domain-containing protein n=1 Tax=Candidatus Methylomirabilis limnetica TaxID=2033718 RepID=A0A2T4TZZ2_9BACT|nr:hypothetical protein [Candidatus Methylomirabilis limnetica]PTL36695.1 hypothetical protein CLG94_03195 [Candidatus Methylomirabilis limnetica]
MSTPRVDVVFPLLDAREHGLECVRSWTGKQSIAREAFRLVIAADGSDSVFEAEVRRVLVRTTE